MDVDPYDELEQDSEPDDWWEHDLGGQLPETSPQPEGLVAVTPVAVTERRCAVCEEPLAGKRSDARYCSGRCRERALRARQGDS